jgi:hypothetical protein
MQRLPKFALAVCFVIASLYPAAGEVTKLTIVTDSSWNALDVEQPGWTSEGYDDSWWEDVYVSGYTFENSRLIWYPGDIKPDVVYFRKTVDISADSFISGKLFVGSDQGSVDLYLNSNSLGSISNDYLEPAEIDILPYLKSGKNIIAAKVDSKGHRWALSSTIRYNSGSTSTPAV